VIDPDPAQRAKAAVGGAATWATLEEALDDLMREPSAPALADLAQKALVQERLAIGPGRFGFRHHLIRDVAYAALPPAERATLHERAADGILGRAGERYPELAELVATTG
jgi:predicted ATPase